MTPFEKLTRDELLALKQKIQDDGSLADWETISSSEFAPMDHILRFWNTNKQFIFDKFGGNLIIEKPIEFQKSKRELYDDFEAEFHNHAFYDAYWRWRRVYKEGCYSYTLGRIFDYQTITDNAWKEGPVEIVCPNGQIFKIVNGMKPMRILRRIAEEFGLEGFEEFRLMHSQVMNTKLLKGTLCLSIHPLDYATMSDNEEGWSSCMSWRERGCYRQGTVEMMNSPVTIVAYLKSNRTVEVGDEMQWNSKRWRCLMVAHESSITSIKGYPYHSEDLNLAAVAWLRELFGADKYGEPFEWQYSHRHEQLNFDGIGLLPRFYSNCMYNDFGCTDNHCISINKDYFLQYIKDYEIEATSYNHYFEINYSGETECLVCGETQEWDHDSVNAELLACLGCDGYIRCRECEEVDHYTNMYYDGGDYICDHCHDVEYVEDPISGNEYPEDNGSYTLRLVKEGTTPGSDDCLTVGHCYNFEFTERDSYSYTKWDRYFKIEAFRWEGGWHGCYYVWPSDLTPDGIDDLFGYTHSTLPERYR